MQGFNDDKDGGLASRDSGSVRSQARTATVRQCRAHSRGLTESWGERVFQEEMRPTGGPREEEEFHK